MINKVILLGNLGADPEVRSTAGGSAVCNLRIATTHRVKDDRGEWNEATEWHRVVCFGRTAENCGKYLAKGRQVYIEGRNQTRKWTDKDGNDRWSTEVVAFDVKFIGGRPEGAGGGGGYSGRSSSRERPRDDNGGGGYGGGGGGRGGGGGGGGSAPPADDIPF